MLGPRSHVISLEHPNDPLGTQRMMALEADFRLTPLHTAKTRDVKQKQPPPGSGGCLRILPLVTCSSCPRFERSAQSLFWKKTLLELVAGRHAMAPDGDL